MILYIILSQYGMLNRDIKISAPLNVNHRATMAASKIKIILIDFIYVKLIKCDKVLYS